MLDPQIPPGGARQARLTRCVILKGVQWTAWFVTRADIDRVYFPLAAFGIWVVFMSACARHARDHERNLTLRWAALIVRTKLGWSSAAIFFESLGQLPGYTDICFGSYLSENLQRLHQAIRRLKVDARFRTQDSAFELSATAAAFHRNESAKVKGVGRKARAHQRRDNRTWSGEDIHAKPALTTSANETKAWIGYSRHSSIRDQGNRLACGNLFDQVNRASLLVVLVQTDHRLLDIVMKEKNCRATRVFGSDQIRFAKGLEGSQGDVLQISNGSRNDRQQRSYQPSATSTVN